jgi:hypothetical protein
MIATILYACVIGAICAALPKFEHLGRGNDKNIIKLKDGPRIYLDDAEFEEFKRTGEIPKSPGVEVSEVGQSPQAAEMANLKDRVKALEAKNAELEQRLAALEAEEAAEDVDEKADRVKALERLKKEKLLAIAKEHGLSLEEGATNPAIAAAIIAHEFPDA